MISVEEAQTIVEQNTARLETETVSLAEVCGRVLAQEIIADTDLPPFDRSQMDGYALKAEETQTFPVKLKIVGESAAGKGWTGELRHGEAVRIMTGAAVPAGANAVQKLEVTKEENDFVEVFEPVKVGQNIVWRASEIKEETILFRPGEAVNRAMIASLASFGYDQVRVGGRPRVSLITTGNELVRVNQKPAKNQIRDSNTLMLRAYAEAAGATVQILSQTDDNLAEPKQQIELATQNSDVLIVSGGVSVGKYDFTKTALRELGAEFFFEKVALRPGKPTVFASLSRTLIFGLPGNPVSAIMTFNLFARIALLKMQGARETKLTAGFAVATADFKGAKERDSYLPVKLSINERGQLLAEPLDWGGSSDFVSFSRANALIIVRQNSTIAARSTAQIIFLK